MYVCVCDIKTTTHIFFGEKEEKKIFTICLNGIGAGLWCYGLVLVFDQLIIHVCFLFSLLFQS